MGMFALPTKDQTIAAVKSWVSRVYKGDFEAAFKASDVSVDGFLENEEIQAILKKCDLGCGITRGLIADRIIFALDKDGDGKLTYEELKAAIVS